MKYLLTALAIYVFLFSTQLNAQPDLNKIQVIASIYEPYSYSNDGETVGVAVEKAKKLFAELNYSPEIKLYPWARAYTTALNTPNALLFSVARTAEREDKFHWVGEIVDFDVYLFKNRDREDINIQTLKDAASFRIGALNKDVKGQYLRKEGIPVLTLGEEENGINLLLTGRLDLVPMDINALKFRLKKMGRDVNSIVPAFHLSEISHPLYIAFNKNTPHDLVHLFKQAYRDSFRRVGPHQ